jgi:hypothetical protein
MRRNCGCVSYADPTIAIFKLYAGQRIVSKTVNISSFASQNLNFGLRIKLIGSRGDEVLLECDFVEYHILFQIIHYKKKQYLTFFVNIFMKTFRPEKICFITYFRQFFNTNYGNCVLPRK